MNIYLFTGVCDVVVVHIADKQYLHKALYRLWFYKSDENNILWLLM